MKIYSMLFSIALLNAAIFLSACVPTSTGTGGAASQRANQVADDNMYQPVAYANAGKKGPTLIVLPGNIKSSSATMIIQLIVGWRANR